ncbi:ComEA family DNA-binding protein [Geobacter sulfurreducens]|uniref:ComEA family DNA-binding protein n=1 Tax=Geobacter sulfurreducens TaxID=35554 RepID=UPI000E64C287|nr:helix-hairpin-helix domain-containing protein [Geobacter sulfurreducens]
MKPRTGHAVYLTLALAVMTLPLLFKGHGTSPLEIPAVAFVRSRSDDRPLSIMITGVPEKSGVYRVARGSTCQSVINMALPNSSVNYLPPATVGRILCDGDVVIVRNKNRETSDVSLGKLAVSQLMLMRIPLDPNRMDIKDWELLPGIGPELARRIVCDRQDNGDFSSFEALERVPGIGPKTLMSLKEFF